MLQYDISTMTLNDLKKLIASGDDTHDNQRKRLLSKKQC